jgi:3-hydroxyacyl-[acyl-carrier-protein] dehydratase
MWHCTEIQFAADHPTAAGHFPGNPIIPGALMLDFVVAAIVHEHESDAVLIKTAKFLQAVRPGECIDLRWQKRPGGGIKFECSVAGQSSLAMIGVIEIERVPA